MLTVSSLIVCSLVHCQPSLKVSPKSVKKFLRKVAKSQTEKQTNIQTDKQRWKISSFAEETGKQVRYSEHLNTKSQKRHSSARTFIIDRKDEAQLPFMIYRGSLSVFGKSFLTRCTAHDYRRCPHDRFAPMHDIWRMIEHESLNPI